MTKGHNQGNTNDVHPKIKTKGQDRKLSDSQKIKAPTREGILKKIKVAEQKDRML